MWDFLNICYNVFGFDFIIIDMVGICKKVKVYEDIEYYFVFCFVCIIENVDVCVFMIDVMEGLQKQDFNIYYIVEKNYKGVVVFVNKWDFVEKDYNIVVVYEEELCWNLVLFNDVLIIFIFIVIKQWIYKVLEKVMEVYENCICKIFMFEFNDVMLEIIVQNLLLLIKGKYVCIKYVQQLLIYVLSFVFFCNLLQYVLDSYK